MRILFTLLSIIISFTLSAQVSWNFATAAPTSGVIANSTVSNIAQGNNNGTTTLITTTSASAGYAGASGTQNAGAAAFTGSLNTSTSTYFEVTFTPASGYRISISNLVAGSRSTTTGPQLLTVRSSLDGYIANLSTATVANNSAWALAPFGAFALTTGAVDVPITLRIFSSNGTGVPAINTANWRIDDLAISYAVAVAPITFKSFTGIRNNTGVQLKWTTSQESNMKNYTLEKSTNGVNYFPIAIINANNAAENTYQFVDVNVGVSASLYRIKITGNEGKISYSTIVRISGEANDAKLTIYPTVSNAKITADFYAPKSTTASIVIIDAIGKVINQQTVLVNSGRNNLPIAINNIANGVYRLRIIGLNINYVASFIKN